MVSKAVSQAAFRIETAGFDYQTQKVKIPTALPTNCKV